MLSLYIVHKLWPRLKSDVWSLTCDLNLCSTYDLSLHPTQTNNIVPVYKVIANSWTTCTPLCPHPEFQSDECQIFLLITWSCFHKDYPDTDLLTYKLLDESDQVSNAHIWNYNRVISLWTRKPPLLVHGMWCMSSFKYKNGFQSNFHNGTEIGSLTMTRLILNP